MKRVSKRSSCGFPLQIFDNMLTKSAFIGSIGNRRYCTCWLCRTNITGVFVGTWFLSMQFAIFPLTESSKYVCKQLSGYHSCLPERNVASSKTLTGKLPRSGGTTSAIFPHTKWSSCPLIGLKNQPFRICYASFFVKIGANFVETPRISFCFGNRCLKLSFCACSLTPGLFYQASFQVSALVNGIFSKFLS